MKPTEMTIRVASEPIHVSADKLWSIVGPGFANVGAWTTSVDKSLARGEAQLDGAPCNERVCHVNISGYSQMSERLTAYDASGRQLTYRVIEGCPPFVQLAQNHWEIRELGPNTSVAEMTCTLRLDPWAGMLLGPFMRWQVVSNLQAVVHELKTYAETGQAVPQPAAMSTLIISGRNYSRLARTVGAVLTFMGLSLMGMYGTYLATGFNALAADLPQVDVIGLMFAASIGSFALPIGGLLLWGGPATQARLPIAGMALGLMALVRLAGFANPEVRALVGAAPLVEFFVLGAIGVAAMVLRPDPAPRAVG